MAPIATGADPGLEISSKEGGEFDLERGTAHYVGQVLVQDSSGLTLKCDDLLADLPVGGGKFNQVVASGNVRIDIVQQPKSPTNAPAVIHVETTRAIYTATNGLLTLSGGTRLALPQGTLTSESPVEYNRRTGKLSTKGSWKTVIHPESLKGGGIFGTEPKEKSP